MGSMGRGFIELGDNSPGLAANQAWRPAPELGVLIPTARENGPVDWNDGEGSFFPTIAISLSSSGPGYSMVTGAFGSGDVDINTGRAGTHASSPEANFSFSAAWFPFDQGWIGGEVAGPDATTGASRWTRATAHAVGITAGMVKWTQFPAESGIYAGLGDILLPGVNSLTNGMIFATSADGGSDVNIVGVAPKAGGSGWTVTIREDSATDAETLASPDQSEFQFLYVPFNAKNLIGGHINGQDGAKLTSAGNYTIARTSVGTYELTIPGETGNSGTLLLQVADFESGTSVPMASRAFLSYEFQNSKFVIQARKTASDTTADLADVDFYFAWVDFQNPLSPPDGPRFRALPTANVTAEGVVIKEANLAVNTDIPQALVTVVDDSNSGGFTDPVTGQTAASALVGRFYNTSTLEPTSEPFIILGNPGGQITRHDVDYNAFSKQYVVVANARTYGPNSLGIPLLALVNTNAASPNPVAKTKVFMEDSDQTFDDVTIAASSKNGNIILVAERNFAGEGEGSIGALFDKDLNQLTPQFGRLDLLQGTGDEDDPDVLYLASRDVFFYVSNTDLSTGLRNRVAGSIVQTTPSAGGALQAQTEQLIADNNPAGVNEGHPASFENPFNGEILTAFDLGGNNVPNGQIAYTAIGAAPTYTFTAPRPEISYVTGTGGDPFQHNHPQWAADTNSGVIVVGYNARQSSIGLPNGYAFNVLDRNGAMMPSQFGLPYFLTDVEGGIDASVARHNIGYSLHSDTFLVAFTSIPGIAQLTGFQITSGETGGGPAPRLTIRLAGQNVEVSWPAGGAFGLQATPSLSSPNWQPVTGAPVVRDGNFVMTVPIEGRARFFRLVR